MTKREAKPENICFYKISDFQHSVATKHARGARRTAFDRSNRGLQKARLEKAVFQKYVFHGPIFSYVFMKPHLVQTNRKSKLRPN
jgi:hypothetical protein